VDDDKKKELFFSGLKTFNGGNYFDAHEIWEELWSEY
jgi:predicted metal-dependent hydrolase